MSLLWTTRAVTSRGRRYLALTACCQIRHSFSQGGGG